MISWVGQFGTITAPLADGADHSTRQIMIGQVEGGKGASAWLQFGAIRRS
jgi:hypothetical protein